MKLNYLYLTLFFLCFISFSCEKTPIDNGAKDEPKHEIIKVETITLNDDVLTIKIGESATLLYEILPETATEKAVSWKSSNSSMVSVSSKGLIKGIALGQSEITVTTLDGAKTDVCTVIVISDQKPAGENDYVDAQGVNRGPGVKLAGALWAPVNCGYDENHKFGLLYQWGRAVGQGYHGEPKEGELADALAYSSMKASADNVHYKGYDDGQYGATPPHMQWVMPKGNGDPAFGLGLNWNTLDVATFGEKIQNPCPKGWKLPSPADFEALLKLPSEFIPSGDASKTPDALPGRWFGSEELFLATSGYRDYNGNFFNRGNEKASIGGYWCDTLYDDYYITAGYLGFFTTETPAAQVFTDHVSFAFSVRCVKK